MFEVMMEPPPRLIPVQNWLNLKHRDRVITTRAVLLSENLFLCPLFSTSYDLCHLVSAILIVQSMFSSTWLLAGVK